MTHTLNDIETPAFVIDEARVMENIKKFQAHCDAQGLKLRPHIKTHKTIRFAKAQVAAGAVGINCQKIGEAEVMADGGLDDILITFNVLGASKLRRLRALSERPRYVWWPTAQLLFLIFPRLSPMRGIALKFWSNVIRALGVAAFKVRMRPLHWPRLLIKAQVSYLMAC